MTSENFLVRLKKFANTEWRNLKINHSVSGIYDEYPCANPNGPVDNSSCEDDNPLCNCPCQTLKPDYYDEDTGENNSEPSNENLKQLSDGLKECNLITENLGSEWLGCLWKKPDHPSSCDCPCVGEKFKNYLEFTRTTATFWDTPKQTSLWREAQMILLSSQKARMVIDGDLTLRPGELINIDSSNIGGNDDTWKPRNFGGRWLVSEISHNILDALYHVMMVTVVRDSLPMDPNKTEDISYIEPQPSDAL